MITLISLRLFIVSTKTLTWTSLTVTPEWCDTAFKLGWNFNFFGLYNVCLDLMLLRRPEGDNLMWTGWNVIAMIDDSDVIVWDVVAMVDKLETFGAWVLENSQGRNSPDAFCCHWWKTQDGYDVILVVTKRMSLTHRAQIFMRCCAEQLVAVQTWCKGIFKTISLPKNDLWRSRLQRADVQRQCCEWKLLSQGGRLPFLLWRIFVD